jgi:hypothetical protein
MKDDLSSIKTGRIDGLRDHRSKKRETLYKFLLYQFLEKIFGTFLSLWVNGVRSQFLKDYLMGSGSDIEFYLLTTP